MRMIDADALHAEISTWPESIMYKDWVQSAIANAPTLTQPNEGAKDKNVPTNEPLTLDDLRKIDTVTPLWVHDLSWGQHKPRLMLVRHVTSNYWSCVDFDGFETIKSDDYGSRYLIYRRPPEGEEEEKHVIEITENL